MLIPAFASTAATELSSVAWEIVGVQGNAIDPGAGRAVEPELLVPFAQNPWPRTLVAIRTDGDGSNLQTAVARVLRSLDPGLPMADVRTIEQTINLSFAADRFYTVFIAAFAAVALVLAAIGIYGVMSFAVVQRQHEIGIRMALGGRPRQVLMQVLWEGMTTALGGTALGAAGAMLIGRLLAGMVYGVEPASASTFVVVASTLVVAALLACFVPARRAASVDPMTALRQP